MLKKFHFTMLALALCLSGCGDSARSTDVLAIQQALSKFEAELGPRDKNRHHVHTFFTSKGSFSIGTQEAKIGSDGVPNFQGKSRTDGFFVAPPMRWVDSIMEAEELVISEYDRNGGFPVRSSTQTERIVIEGEEAESYR